MERLKFAEAAGETKTAILKTKELDQPTEVGLNFIVDSNLLGADHLILNVDGVNAFTGFDASSRVLFSWTAIDTIKDTVTFDLQSGEQRVGTNVGDTRSSIENLIVPGDANMIGTSGSNTLMAADPNQTLFLDGVAQGRHRRYRLRLRGRTSPGKRRLTKADRVPVRAGTR